MTLEFVQRLVTLDVLLLDDLGLFDFEVVPLDVFLGRQLGDLLDPLGVQDVGRVEALQGGLLEVVDVAVVEPVAVEFGADCPEDLIAEIVAIGVEIHEFELLADGLECFGELGFEECSQLFDFGGPLGIEDLGNLLDIDRFVVDPHIKRDADVGADVVLADQTVFAFPCNLDPLDREVHLAGGMGHGNDDHALAGLDPQSTDTGANNRFLRTWLTVKGTEGEETYCDDGDKADDRVERDFPDFHYSSPSLSSLTM